MNRNHVHLSADIATAIQVGSRHGKPVILKIDCKTMVNEEIEFFESENKVWLTEFVDSRFIEILKD